MNKIISLIIGIVDKVPFLKGYRTVILTGTLGVVAVLDKFGVGPGNLYDTISPVIWPLAVVTGLAHETK